MGIFEKIRIILFVCYFSVRTSLRLVPASKKIASRRRHRYRVRSPPALSPELSPFDVVETSSPVKLMSRVLNAFLVDPAGRFASCAFVTVNGLIRVNDL